MIDLDNLDIDGVITELDDGRGIVEDGYSGLSQIRDTVRPRGYEDAFQVELERIREAARTAGVKDEFYHLVEAQLSRMRELNAAAVSVGNPPSATGKRLGGNVTLTSGVVINSAPVARWQGQDNETCPVTINLGPVTPLAVSTAVIRPFAYLRWGTYGYNYTAEVDVGTGRQLTVNASMVEVEMALEALAAANSAQANLAATLSFRAMVRTSPLCRTRYIDSLAQNGTSTVVVPPYATGILPVQMSDTSGQVQLDFYDTSGTLRYSLQITNGTQISAIPLTGDIVRVIVTNLTGTTQHIRLPFELSI